MSQVQTLALTFNGTGLRAPLKPGIYTVRYSVKDDCGNISECDAEIGIWPKAPTPYCVSISSAVMKNGLVELWARDFDRGSFTNCNNGVMIFTFNRDGQAEHPNSANITYKHYFRGLGESVAVLEGPNKSSDAVIASALALYNQGKVQLWLPEVTVIPSNSNAADQRILTGGSSGMQFGCKAGNNISIPIITEMRVWDYRSFKSGSTQGSDFCSTRLTLIDNQGGCGEGSLVSLSGTVQTETKVMMKDVEVSLGAELPEYPVNVKTDNDGIFAFGNLPVGVSYSVTPKKEGDYTNGVNTLDLVQIQRHILGIKKLDNPYKMIAADADGDQSIRVNDIVEIRKLILGIADKFTASPSWRFVDGSEKMEQGPWPFKEVIAHGSLIESNVDNNFVAVKIGDVDGTAGANAVNLITEPRSVGVILTLEDKLVKSGEEVTVSLNANQFNEVHGMQWTLQHEGLELINVDGRAIDLTSDHIGKVSSNSSTFSWAGVNAMTIENGNEVMRITFRANKNTKLSEALQITSEVTNAEAYIGSALERSGIALEVRSKEGLPFALQQNEPNPWKASTSIKYSLPEAGDVKLTILDVTGRIIQSFDHKGEAGQNEVILTRQQLNGATGMMIYKIESGKFSEQRKMLVIE
jgi:hypothetical protein